MFVADVYEDCRSITNFADEARNFARITDAVEVLSNKGNFDASLYYVDLLVNDEGIVVLPNDVETPLAITIAGNPSFARDRLYEFTLNGPGSDAPRVGWTWEDKGTTPILNPGISSTQVTVESNIDDDGKTVSIGGRTTLGFYAAEVLTLDADTPPHTVYSYKEIEQVHKDVTTHGITLFSYPNMDILSTYYGYDTETEYRKIRISTGGSKLFGGDSVYAHILFKRRRYRVVSQQDFIPIRSKMALILMLKSLEAYREERFAEAEKLEAQAIKLANEEQGSHNAFAELSAPMMSATIMNLNYNNRDVIIVADIYDEACQIVGPVGQQKVFDKITEAASILSNKGQWDSQRGYVDIRTDQYEYVTLPRYVDYVIELNINGYPAEMKSKWFEFNQGGPGSRWVPCDTWTDIGTVVTNRDVLYTQQLSVVPDLDADLGIKVRVYGYYKGKRISSINTEGVAEDGFEVTPSASGEIGSPQPVDRIERITKEKSAGFVRLYGRDLEGQNEIQLGYYWPDETEPVYRRIRLPKGCETVRIMYRRRDAKFTSLTDPIHLKSKTSILTMLRAVELLNAGKVAEAEAMEQKAVKYLVEDNLIYNQSEVPTIDFGGSYNITSGDYYPWA